MIDLSNTSSQGLAFVWAPDAMGISDGWQSPTAELVLNPGDVVLMRISFTATSWAFAWSASATGAVTAAFPAVPNVFVFDAQNGAYSYQGALAQTVVFNSAADRPGAMASFGIAVSSVQGSSASGSISNLAIIVRKVVFGKAVQS